MPNTSLGQGNSVIARRFPVFFILVMLAGWALPVVWAQGVQPAMVVSSPATASVGQIAVKPRADGVSLDVAVSATVSPDAIRLSNPDRLVFDFRGCDFKGATRTIAVNHGPVKQVRLSLFSAHPPITRMVVDVAEALNYQVKAAANGIVTVDISFPKDAVGAAATTAPAPVRSAAPAKPDATSATSARDTTSAAPAQMQAETTPDVMPRAQPGSTSAASRGPLPPAEVLTTAPAATASPAPPESPGSGSPSPGSPSSGPPSSGSRSQPGAYSLMARARALSVADLQALEDKAQTGDPEAQTMLALAYHAGMLLKQDDVEAKNLLRKAADREYMAAQESLGIFTETGIGMERPAPAEALAWYQKAAQNGSVDAATDIGLMYANGRGVAQDPVQAVTWFRRAAEGGDASAEYNLALMYERGEGAPRDYREAVRWLKASADQNLVPAIIELAELSYQPPDPAIAKDLGRAMEYYEKAAGLGSAVADVRLGTIYTKGLPGKVNYDEAAKWYRKAADQNDPDGELGLGVAYALGHGVPVDYEQARRLLSASADRGQVEAEYDFAIMCEEGSGAPADRDTAARYYQMAADRGMVKAQYRYGLMLAKGSDSATSRTTAYKWLMLAQGSIPESAQALSDLRKAMSAEEIDKAERDVDAWRLAHRPAAQ